MANSAAEKLRLFYAQFTGEDKVLVMINADPDAIACAMAVKRLLWRKVASVKIASINVINRPDNIAMIRLLGIKIEHIDDVCRENFTKSVVVDSQPDHDECFSMCRPNVIIDHHPETCAVADYCDIRPKYGAAASILTEYLRAAKIKPSAKLATALFFAIKTDTSDFERNAVPEDIRAFQFLFRHANVHLARRIDQAELQPEYLDDFQLALLRRVKRRDRLFVNLSRVSTPDVLVLVADFFMRVNNVTWTVVAGICDEKLIVIFRNDGLRKDAGKVASQSFGKLGSAGGHKSMARAEVPLDNLTEVNFNDYRKLQRWIINQVERQAGKK